KRGTDRVRAARDRLAARAAVGGRYAIPRQEAKQGAGKGWISTAIGLIGRVRRNRGVLLLDREVSDVVGYVVVAKHTCGAERGTDRVRAARDRLAGRAAVGGSYAIGRQEANQRAGEGWISIAVSLICCIRRNGSVLFLDGEVGCVVGYVVVPKHTCGAKCRTNL